ncbi:hypothetical protein SUDANB145_04368 [Streptomyces sp. enrichment culture]|uniref:hypothetical protein n=1 Tax=Streptomyces sp. ISL-12 TaxID=2819177 RepID=UPI001BEA7478|nr:hypothetical protein [Streptomyces sp. ISL-12]MBT2415252.1 hypothetical protein [Streptomyces sp. ISL-12]
MTDLIHAARRWLRSALLLPSAQGGPESAADAPVREVPMPVPYGPAWVLPPADRSSLHAAGVGR